MRKWITKKLTTNYKEVPLFYVHFDLNKYKNNGDKGSCELMVYPSLKGDEHKAWSLFLDAKYIE